ncbi:MAG: DUF4389 domain-containing protein [Planktomarina sp.]
MAHDPENDGYILNEPRTGQAQESLFWRLLWMIVIGAMMSFAQTVLTVVTVIQFIILLTNGRNPNEQLADFGTTIGIWIAKAARYQTAASEVRPWPWSDLD